MPERENLDEVRFKEYCARRNVSEEITQAHINIVKDFEAFLRKTDKNKDFSDFSINDARSFVAKMIKNGKNTIDSFVGLIRYSNFLGKREVVSFLFGYIEGCKVMEKLSETLEERMGDSWRDAIFKGIDLPPLGTNPEEKPKTTKRIMQRLEAKLDEKTLREIMSSGLDVGPREFYLPLRNKFLESKSLDNFLRQRHAEAVEMLEKHSKDKSMFYAQEIDEEVVEFVRSNQEIMGGIREGNIIYETKIPYLTKKYLREKNPKMKRYYACHCGWVREAIQSGMRISSNFCYCSAGYHKRPWEIIFGEPIKADIIETVLKGGLVCRFAIDVPRKFSMAT